MYHQFVFLFQPKDKDDDEVNVEEDAEEEGMNEADQGNISENMAKITEIGSGTIESTSEAVKDCSETNANTEPTGGNSEIDNHTNTNEITSATV